MQSCVKGLNKLKATDWKMMHQGIPRKRRQFIRCFSIKKFLLNQNVALFVVLFMPGCSDMKVGRYMYEGHL